MCDGKEGKWKEMGDADGQMVKVYNAVLGEPGEGRGTHALNELVCDPEHITLEVTEENMGAGGQLSCTQLDDPVDGKYTIVAPNKCLLICDFHLGMTIEGRLDEDSGEFAFFIVETGENITGKGDRVACWGSATTTADTTTTTPSTTTTTATTSTTTSP